MYDIIPLVEIDHEPRVDSRLIAEQLGVEHESFRKLLYQYQDDFEEFGQLRFEIGVVNGEFSGFKPLNPVTQLRFETEVGRDGFPDLKSENLRTPSKGGRPEKFALLNEDQSYLGLTYVQNTPQARALKKRLVRSFGEHRRLAADHARVPFPRSATINAIIDRLCARRPAYPQQWLLMMWTLLEEIDRGRYTYPYAYRTLDGRRCLVFRTSHATEYLRTANHLQTLWRDDELFGDRVFKRELRRAGVLMKLRIGPVIGKDRFDHAVAVDLDALRQPMDRLS